MTRALITGGAGFIGSHLADYLLHSGWDVLILDDLSTGYLSNLQKSPKLTFEGRAIAACGNSELLDMVASVDYVFHLASMVGVRRVLDYPLDTIEGNIINTMAILSAAAKLKRPTIMTSSSEVYGNIFEYELDKDGLSEDMPLLMAPPTQQRYGYAAAKLAEEHIALAHHQASGFPVVVARLFNTIGPRQVSDHGMVVPRFIEQASAHEPITIYGDGLQRRSFTWVGDVARALVELVQCEQAWGEIVNVGSQDNATILQIAVMIRRLAESNSRLVHVPYIEAYGREFEDIRDRVPDLTKIEKLIGFRSSTNLHGMLRDTMLAQLTAKIGAR